MKSKIIIMTAVAAIAVVAGIAVLVVSSPSNSSANDNDDTKEIEVTEQLMAPSITAAPAMGSESAKVTIVEFGDYQCTWCYRWHEGTKDTLINDYVTTGKVRFLFKDFPINDLSDRASSLAAEGSYCAADQGKYWEYHDEVYSNWDGENTGWLTKESIQQFAKDSGVSDMPKFSDCLNSGKYSSVVKTNYNLARTVGLDATPSFIVLTEGETPKLIRGAHPYSTFENVINEAYAS